MAAATAAKIAKDSATAGTAASAEFKPTWFANGGADLVLSRFVMLRALGFMYFVAFLCLAEQWQPLLGDSGLMPVHAFLSRLQAQSPSPGAAFWRVPSLFWLNASDAFTQTLAWLGVVLSAFVTLGLANVPVMFTLWLTYLSFVHVGQIFYGYGWEMLLLEAGFLAIFLAPTWKPSPRIGCVAPLPLFWLFRWLTFRVMFGAGLIKLRGDPCWTDLTCLIYHYETQPNPHPLSWLLHQGPTWFHQLGVLLNHFVELIVPFGLFGPRRLRHIAGALTISFQALLIASGNLSFLNWLTIAVALACFDDSLWRRLLPRKLVAALVVAPLGALTKARRLVTILLCVGIGILSLNPLANMLNPQQRMNASFDPLHLVNTYGAFGSVGKHRQEVIIQGTLDDYRDPRAKWLDYEFPCKPGRVDRAPCLVTPYHYRLDWQLWFAALSNYKREPWIVHLVYKLLAGDPSVLPLLAENPFEGQPPRFARVLLYDYEFTSFAEPGWWRRQPAGTYVPATSLEDPSLLRFLRARGWLEP